MNNKQREQSEKIAAHHRSSDSITRSYTQLIMNHSDLLVEALGCAIEFENRSERPDREALSSWNQLLSELPIYGEPAEPIKLALEKAFDAYRDWLEFRAKYSQQRSKIDRGTYEAIDSCCFEFLRVLRPGSY